LYEKTKIVVTDNIIILGKEKEKKVKKPQQAKNVKINTKQNTIKVYR